MRASRFSRCSPPSTPPVTTPRSIPLPTIPCAKSCATISQARISTSVTELQRFVRDHRADRPGRGSEPVHFLCAGDQRAAGFRFPLYRLGAAAGRGTRWTASRRCWSTFYREAHLDELWKQVAAVFRSGDRAVSGAGVARRSAGECLSCETRPADIWAGASRFTWICWAPRTRCRRAAMSTIISSW